MIIDKICFPKKGDTMEHIRKIGIIIIIITAIIIGYIAMQRYQEHHKQDIKIQSTGIRNSSGQTSFLPCHDNICPE